MLRTGLTRVPARVRSTAAASRWVEVLNVCAAIHKCIGQHFFGRRFGVAS